MKWGKILIFMFTLIIIGFISSQISKTNVHVSIADEAIQTTYSADLKNNFYMTRSIIPGGILGEDKAEFELLNMVENDKTSVSILIPIEKLKQNKEYNLNLSFDFIDKSTNPLQVYVSTISMEPTQETVENKTLSNIEIKDDYNLANNSGKIESEFKINTSLEATYLVIEVVSTGQSNAEFEISNVKMNIKENFDN